MACQQIGANYFGSWKQDLTFFWVLEDVVVAQRFGLPSVPLGSIPGSREVPVGTLHVESNGCFTWTGDGSERRWIIWPPNADQDDVFVRPQPITPEMATEARDRRARGETLLSIAKALGVSRTSVSRYVDDAASTRPETSPCHRRAVVGELAVGVLKRY